MNTALATTRSRPWLKTYAELGLDWQRLPELPEINLAGYVEAHARNFPERAALVYLGYRISYRELERQANRLANLLLAQGCTAGDVLGIHLPNIPQYVAAFLAAAKLNMVVTSISPLLTPPEIINQANDAGVKILLTLDGLYANSVRPLAGQVLALAAVLVTSATEMLPLGTRTQIPETALGSVPVLALDAALEGAADSTVLSAARFDDVLFLQYTGGTTGKPKGAELTLRNIFINNLQVDVFNRYRLGQETIASAFPMFHIGGAAIMHNALRCAATLLLIPDPRNVEQFCAEMRAHPPTVIANVPALFQMLLGSESFLRLDFSQLRLAISAAAPFTAEEILRLEAVIGQGKVSEVYGMTETAPVQTCNPPQRFKLGFVGLPIPGTDVRIVDAESGRDMPPGEPGEIIVRGPQVMRGYLKSPEVTAETLRTLDGEAWLYTGDVGLMDEDGYIKLCDRSKDMLIVGGYKVFSVEVEGKVQALPFVALSALVGRPDTARPGNDITRLYVQRKPGVGASEEELRAEITTYCRANMAPYKVPKEILFVPAIPLTSVGKIDKKALRALATS